MLSVGRPAIGGGETTIRLFRIEPDGHTAVRVPVQLGRSSFDAVEVLGGLEEGDRVILSEMSQLGSRRSREAPVTPSPSPDNEEIP